MQSLKWNGNESKKLRPATVQTVLSLCHNLEVLMFFSIPNISKTDLSFIEKNEAINNPDLDRRENLVIVISNWQEADQLAIDEIVEELNQGLPETNPAGSQSGT